MFQLEAILYFELYIYLDYCIETCGTMTSNSREKPTMSQLFVAVMRECILNLDSESSLWHKLKLLAFLLNLSSSNTQFSHLYDIFHEVIFFYILLEKNSFMHL